VWPGVTTGAPATCSSQVPLVSGYESIRSLVRPAFLGGFREMVDADREARGRGEVPAMVPAVEGPAGSGGVARRTRTGARAGQLCPADRADTAADAGRAKDVLAPTELAPAAYETVREPKKLVVLPGGHFDACVAGFEASAVPARDWFLQHLGA
jgi:hypothetical protein